MDNEKMKSNIMDVLNFYHKLDRNSSMLDDLDERLQPENLKFEIENLKEFTEDWKENGYLDADEVEWIYSKLNII